MRGWIGTLALAIGFGLAACETEVPEEDDLADGMEATVEDIDATTGADTLDAPTLRQRVVVRAASYGFEPREIAVGPGEVRFVVTNPADVRHGFEVEGHGLERSIEIEPGTTDSLTVTLTEPGEYVIYCPVGDHRERGMTGTLVVQEPAP